MNGRLESGSIGSNKFPNCTIQKVSSNQPVLDNDKYFFKNDGSVIEIEKDEIAQVGASIRHGKFKNQLYQSIGNSYMISKPLNVKNT